MQKRLPIYLFKWGRLLRDKGMREVTVFNASSLAAHDLLMDSPLLVRGRRRSMIRYYLSSSSSLVVRERLKSTDLAHSPWRRFVFLYDKSGFLRDTGLPVRHIPSRPSSSKMPAKPGRSP